MILLYRLYFRTSIPASWKKIKGERHFQRDQTTSSLVLPTIEKALLAPIQPTVAYSHAEKAASEKGEKSGLWEPSNITLATEIAPVLRSGHVPAKELDQ